MADTTLEVLGEDECLSLLAQAQYGRVAVVVDQARPEILPVNFVVHQRTVAFATSSPLLLTWAPLGNIAFEADWVDLSSHEGWDVVVSGVGADITDSLDNLSQLVREDQIDIWAPGANDRWIAILKPSFAGRRLYRPAASPTFG